MKSEIKIFSGINESSIARRLRDLKSWGDKKWRHVFLDDGCGMISEDFGDGTYQIGNVPWVTHYNAGDVVRGEIIKDKYFEDLVWAREILYREWDAKVGIRYRHKGHGDVLRLRFKDLGCKADYDRRDLVLVAHNFDVVPDDVIADMKGVQIVGRSPNKDTKFAIGPEPRWPQLEGDHEYQWENATRKIADDRK